MPSSTNTSALHTLTFSDLLSSIAAKTPSPGGGGVASAAGALAAVLAHMVVAYSLGKANLAAHQPALEEASSALTRSVDLLLTLADEDAAAYSLVNELSKLPETDPRRQREYPPAVDAAVQAPRAVIGVCCDLLRLFEALSSTTNRHLRSDLAIAAILAEAAARAGWWNVRINLPLLSDPARRGELTRESEQMLAEALTRRNLIEQACV